MKERKARVEGRPPCDARRVEEGIVAGGGVALLRCAKGHRSLQLEGDEKIGSQIVRRAMNIPSACCAPTLAWSRRGDPEGVRGRATSDITWHW